MNRKITMMFIVTTLLLLLLGVVNASEVSNDTAVISDTQDISIHDTPIMDNTVKDTITEQKESKEITKEYKNQKTASKTYDVSNFDSLHSALTSDEYDTVTVNIKSNIILSSDTTLNEDIKTLTINGNGKTINGKDQYQFLDIDSNSKITIKNIEITNCYASSGGAISNSEGNLTIINSTLNNNYAYDDGGAIYDDEGTLTIINSTLNNNTANDDGGAIYSYGTDLIIGNTTLKNNKAKWYGGAICFESYTVWFTTTHYAGGMPIGQTRTLVSRFGSFESTNNKYLNNTAGNGTTGSRGGAIYNIYSNESKIKNDLFDNNEAVYGGVIFNTGTGEISLTNSTFTNNTAEEFGGAILNNNGTMSITKSVLNNNHADMYGGAVRNFYGRLNITDSILNNNYAEELGGAIINEADLLIINSTLNNNYANDTGGSIFNFGENLTIKKCTFNNNSANSTGGAIYNGEILTIINSTFNNNSANNGGAIYNAENLTITNSTLKNNIANRSGGAIYSISDYVTINGNMFQSNNAGNGAAIYNKQEYEDVGDMEDNPGPYEIINNKFINNNATNNGGAIYNAANNVNITQNTFTNNYAKNGTSIYNNGSYYWYTETRVNTGSTYLYFYSGAVSVAPGESYPWNDCKDYGNNINIINNTFTNSEITPKTIINTNGTNISIIKNTFNQTILNNTGNAIYNNGSEVIIKDNINNTFSLPNIIYNSASESSITENIFINTKLILNTTITISSNNTNPTVNEKIKLTYTLKDNFNNTLSNEKISTSINGKSYNITTNNKGIATQEYIPTISGTQKITATYNGNTNYNKNTTAINITVKKINTKLTLTVSNTTPINNTPINVTATLTDTNNKKIANHNITLNIAGKTYKIKTNSNGMATQSYTPVKVETQTITATYKGTNQYNNSTASAKITVKKINTKLTLSVSNSTPVNNTPITITSTLTDANNKKLASQNITLNINGKSYTLKTNANGVVTQSYTPTKISTQTITAAYKGNSQYNNSTATTKITVKNKINTKTTTSTVKGIIGEKLTLKATVTDTSNKKINEGNLIFKLNGVTIKDNGKLTGSSNPLKVKVTNGVATATITPDLDMRNADKLTASYIGTAIYNASASSAVKIQVSQRNASIVVSSNVKTIKQGQVLTLTAKVYDTTNGKKSTNLAKFADEFVYFKVNGITLKDSKGNMLKVKVVNGTATTKYTIPLGLSGVTDGKTMTPKNHTILAGFYNKNYQENIRNTSTFQVERSNITISIANATVNNKTHKLSLKATIKDYLGNIVSGPNKCVIKINGVSLKNGTEPMYYYSTNGILTIKNIDIPAYNKYASIEIVTQDRLAYKSQRNTTSVIKVVK
ncbi:Ig-like domain-containing protein [Methanosphaera sp. BMS]|uniref:beta strand repeat-containing protein n=1 Tax=Methanosphaera sp. BMS TaxID=1789762 RepID=UPI000DC1DC92|nr:Ig-like domain-containing protein [Methanosphaera sp. BMS]AWX31729.1 hypothetical protein AW729_00895 [Methanosphaera sp. BMS]